MASIAEPLGTAWTKEVSAAAGQVFAEKFKAGPGDAEPVHHRWFCMKAQAQQ